jgi:hypothetical protein
MPAGIDRSAIRPHRAWFVVAALICVGALAAPVLLVKFTPGGTVGQRFATGQPITVQLSPSQPTMVWAPAGESIRLTCATQPLGFTQRDSQTIRMTADDTTVEREAYGQRWRGVLIVVASPAGNYELTCTSNEPGSATTTLAVGDPPRFLDLRSRATGAAILLGAVCVGLISAGAIFVVVAMRRASYRRRLPGRAAAAASPTPPRAPAPDAAAPSARSPCPNHNP